MGWDWPMRFVAFTFKSYFPALAGLNGMVHSRNEYLPRSFPSPASRHVFPPSCEKRTSLIPYPPSKAMPRTFVSAPAFTFCPSVRLVINERTLYRVMGLVFFGVVPGSMQAQALSGTR